MIRFPIAANHSLTLVALIGAARRKAVAWLPLHPGVTGRVCASACRFACDV